MSALPRHVTLPDGRRLDIRVTGPQDGLLLVFHLGTWDAAVRFPQLERAACDHGLHLVTMSRPGYGDSTRQAGRRVVDVVPDTAAVLAALGADRCLVGGWSGGGPHALACAARLDAAVAVFVIAGLSPYECQEAAWASAMGADLKGLFDTALRGEDALRAALTADHEKMKKLTVAELQTDEGGSEADRAALAGEFGDWYVASYREAMRNGVDGALDDLLAFVKPWGFALGEIEVPTMIWHGDADLALPAAHGRWLASSLLHARFHLEEGEGHLSLVGALDRMLDELVESVSEGTPPV
jgi:pimeloyl-ACP methyl ester carboxylesterase